MLIKESIENTLSPIIKKMFHYATPRTLQKYEHLIEEAMAQTKLNCGNTKRVCNINCYSHTQANVIITVPSGEKVLSFKLSVFSKGKMLILSRAIIALAGKGIAIDGGLDTYQGNINIEDYSGPEEVLDIWNRLFVVKQDPAAAYAC